MNISPNPVRLFKKKAPEFASAFNHMVTSFIKTKSSGKNSLQASSVSMNPSTDNSLAIQLHITKLSKLNGSKEKILKTVLVTFTSI